MEEQEQAPFPLTQPMSSGLASDGALQYQFENPDLVASMLHDFSGEDEVFDPKTMTKVWKRVNVPMVNEKGLAMIKGYLRMFLTGSKNFALTDVGDDYIAESVIQIGRIMRDELYDNWVEYGVKDYSSASYIVDRITDVAYTIKKKGDRGTYLHFLTKTHNVNEIQHHQSMAMGRPQSDKKGVMDILFGGKRR